MPVALNPVARQFAASRGPMAAFVAVGLVWGGFMACLPDLKAALGASDGQMGMILIFGSVAAMSQMLLSPWLARFLGRTALPLGVVVMAVAVALPGQAATPAFFVGAMLVLGGATGAVDVWMNARLAAIEAGWRMALMNLNHAAYSFAYGGAAAMAGLARAAGWTPASILGVIALAVFALAFAAMERDGAIEGMARSPAGPVPGLGLVPVIAGALVLTAFLAENAAEAWSALYIERDLGAAPGSGSAGPALLGVTMGLGRILGQMVAQRISGHALLRLGLAVAALGGVAVAAAGSPFAAYAGFAVLGLGVSVVAPTALAIAGRLSGPEVRGRAIARTTVIGYMGFFLGPPVMGLVAEGVGLRASYALIAMALLGALAIGARLRRLDR